MDGVKKHISYDKLKSFKSTKVKITRDNRYNAHRRMARSQISSSICISIVSLEIVAVGVLQLINDSTKEGAISNDNLTALTIILSTFVLVLSLIVSTFDYEGRKDNYHKCGIKLSKLCDKIDSELTYATEIPKDVFDKYVDEYNNIMADHGLNHERKDYKKSQLDDFNKNKKRYTDYPQECPFTTNRWLRFWAWMNWYVLDPNTLYWFLTISGAVMVLYIAFRIVW